MAGRRKPYVFEIIEREKYKCLEHFEHMPIRGRNTSQDVIKNIRDELEDMYFRIARTCNVLVNYPRMHIEGTKVVLGEATILLPDCKYAGIEKLKEIELRRGKRG